MQNTIPVLLLLLAGCDTPGEKNVLTGIPIVRANPITNLTTFISPACLFGCSTQVTTVREDTVAASDNFTGGTKTTSPVQTNSGSN